MEEEKPRFARKNEENAKKIKIIKLFLKKPLTNQLNCGIICRLKNYILSEEFKMSTFMAKPETVKRGWYVIDAAGKPLGRVAVVAANILRGKHRATFTPHVDCGEYVIIVNADKAILTGNKMEQKYYRRHSGYIGGLKEIQYKTLMAKKPELAMQLAVKGMLPHNTIGAKSITRLKVYAGSEHNHAAQQPVAVEV